MLEFLNFTQNQHNMFIIYIILFSVELTYMILILNRVDTSKFDTIFLLIVIAIIYNITYVKFFLD